MAKLEFSPFLLWLYNFWSSGDLSDVPLYSGLLQYLNDGSQNYLLYIEQQSRVCNIGKIPPVHSDGVESVSWTGSSRNVVQGVVRHASPLHFTALRTKVLCFLCTAQYAIVDTVRSTLLHFNLKSAFHRQYRTELCNFCNRLFNIALQEKSLFSIILLV